VFGRRRPSRIFITQNGDWPAFSDDSEFRLFQCDGLVCTNPDYFERNRDRYKCALIPNGVDLERFRPGPPERDRFGLPETPIVLMVSALIPSKNVAAGVKAMASVPSATLVVAGDGPLRDEIRTIAEELIPGRYIQTRVPAAEMPALYRSADAFMHLSVDESFGNVFVEALASGLPIVAYDTPRTRWIVGEQEFLAEPGSIESLTGQIDAALEESGSRAAERHRRAEDFGWPAIGRRYAEFLCDEQPRGHK
jgi:glycosyltransferase involved in cell wall biosynthesis